MRSTGDEGKLLESCSCLMQFCWQSSYQCHTPHSHSFSLTMLPHSAMFITCLSSFISQLVLFGVLSCSSSCNVEFPCPALCSTLFPAMSHRPTIYLPAPLQGRACLVEGEQPCCRTATSGHLVARFFLDWDVASSHCLNKYVSDTLLA